jgi:ABC-type Fe3+-hydroxamate transport system substrate-binding protein
MSRRTTAAVAALAASALAASAIAASAIATADASQRTAVASEAPVGGDAKRTAPVRVATLVPYVAHALAGVPEHAVVVASVRRSMHEPPPPGVTDLGSPHAPSLEQLAAARPDLVVGDRAMHATRTDDLGRFGASVVLVDSSSVEATFTSLRELGARIGAAEPLGERVQSAESAIAGLAVPTPVDTLALFGTPASFLVLTSRTWQGDLLARLNLRNLAAGATGRERIPGYAEVSDEVLVGMRPRLVVIVAHSDPKRIRQAFVQRLDDGPWRRLRDSATAGVHVLDPELFGANPGLAMPEAARRLRDLAAPAVVSPAATSSR